jgi:bla regulator protein BlaR1
MMPWFAENMIWASLTMALVLLIRRPVAFLFGAGPAYALWLLPAARLLMPPPASLGAEFPSIVPALEVIVSVEGSPLPLQGSGAAASWMPWLAALWLGGAAAFLVWQWLGYRHFLTTLSLDSRSLGGHAGLPLIESAAVQGPLALGLLDRRIVVPADFTERYSPGEQRLALDHEAVHHRRGDIWWNLAALLVLALNWFNPLAWLAFRAFREDQELACDAAVAGAAPPEAREAYGRALIKSASRPGLIAACPLNHVDQLKRRLRMMKDHRNSRLRMLGGAAAVTLLAGVTATFGSPGLAHPHPEGETKSRSERIVIMTHKGDRPAGDAEHRVRIRRGEGGEVVIPECDPANRTEVNEGADNERTRIVLCSQGAATPAERAERLQRARDRLARMDDLSEEQRARVTAALDREIARLRGQ